MDNREAGGIRGLILDYGEVICNPPSPEAFGRLAAAAGLDPETFAARYHRQRGPYDRADLSPAEYWSTVVAENVRLDEALLHTLEQQDVAMWSDVNRDMTDWLGALHAAGLKTGLLSNMPFDMAARLRTFDWLHHLDCVILSCELRVIKPDPAIYLRCLEGLGLAPSEACFIDDREVNVQGARDTGLAAVRFQTVKQLRQDLAAIGIAVLPHPRA